jgi:hypothetical protein
MTKSSSQRQAGEIDITDEVIGVGADMLARYYGDPGEPRENLYRAVEAVFEAMVAAAGGRLVGRCAPEDCSSD